MKNATIVIVHMFGSYFCLGVKQPNQEWTEVVKSILVEYLTEQEHLVFEKDGHPLSSEELATLIMETRTANFGSDENSGGTYWKSSGHEDFAGGDDEWSVEAIYDKKLPGVTWKNLSN